MTGNLMTDTSTTPAPAKRGFAALSLEHRRAIASMGGTAAHISGAAHCFDSATARAASLKRRNIRLRIADPLASTHSKLTGLER